MAKKAGLTGVENVMRNLNREIKKLRGRSMAGLIKGAIIIVRDMDKTPPLIPVDLGNLRASRFIVSALGNKGVSTSGFKGKDKGEMKAQHSSVTSKLQTKVSGSPEPLVAFGLSANYAAAVEENKDPKVWNREGSGRAFMQSSIKRNQGKVLLEIAKTSEIK